MSGAFISCDWGTTHFRLRVHRPGDVAGQAKFESDEGAAKLAAGAPAMRAARFADVLSAGLRRLAELGGAAAGAPIVISGMASSSIGWRELGYASVPWRVDGADLVCEELEPLSGKEGPHRVLLVSGARTACDVLRGEETQVVGLFRLPALAGLAERSVLIMPGTHSKHLRVEQGKVVDFQTFMTGELFDVLGRHSILRHSVDPRPSDGSRSSEQLASFSVGVDEGAERPLSAALFRVRTRAVLDGFSAAENREFLSGLLIAGELAYLKDDEPSAPIVLGAAPALESRYAAALARLGLADRLTVVPALDVERLTALGQECLLRRQELKGHL
jgi:2-dehydro-3-deoxygalactonokinase